MDNNLIKIGASVNIKRTDGKFFLKYSFFVFIVKTTRT